MWETLESAAIALARDGWKRCTAYWWYKVVGAPNDRKIWVELEWASDRSRLLPIVHNEEE